MSKETIANELIEFGYEVTDVTNVISRFRTPLPMFFVVIAKSRFNENIFTTLE